MTLRASGRSTFRDPGRESGATVNALSPDTYRNSPSGPQAGLAACTPAGLMRLGAGSPDVAATHTSLELELSSSTLETTE